MNKLNNYIRNCNIKSNKIEIISDLFKEKILNFSDFYERVYKLIKILIS
jgi:hypothetical protein